MKRWPTASPKGARAAFCVAVLAFVPSAFAGDVPGKRAESAIGIVEGRYVFAGQSYANLDALDAALRAARPVSDLIVGCTPAATASWLAAVPRFDDLPMRWTNRRHPPDRL